MLKALFRGIELLRCFMHEFVESSQEKVQFNKNGYSNIVTENTYIESHKQCLFPRSAQSFFCTSFNVNKDFYDETINNRNIRELF